MEEQKFSLLGIEMPFDEFDRLLREQSQGKELKVVNGKVVATVHEATDAEILSELRARRKELLSAFDKWEKAVLRGREIDDERIMSWYNNLLNLDASAFENIPERINYYLQDGALNEVRAY